MNPNEYEITSGYVGSFGIIYKTATPDTLAEAVAAAAKRNGKTEAEIIAALESGAAIPWCDSPNYYYDHGTGYIRRKRSPRPSVAVQSVVVDIDSGLGIGRIADADPASEALAALEAVEIMKRQAANDPHARTPRLCDCGHYDAFPMTTARGSACADCYDRWSD